MVAIGSKFGASPRRWLEAAPPCTAVDGGLRVLPVAPAPAARLLVGAKLDTGRRMLVPVTQTDDGNLMAMVDDDTQLEVCPESSTPSM